MICKNIKGIILVMADMLYWHTQNNYFLGKRQQSATVIINYYFVIH